MKKRLVRMVVGCCLSLLFLWSIPLTAQERMVSPDRLKGVEIGYEIVTVNDFRRISPLKLKAKKGTTVIWFNNGRSPLSIMFKGDQKVYVACKEPVSFVVGLDGSFVSTWIPNGATASLCFIEAGTYQYEVVYSFPRGEGTNRHTKGTVHIE